MQMMQGSFTSRAPAMRAALTVAAVLFLSSPAAWAARNAEPRHLGTFRDWSAWMSDEAAGPVCWMASKPKRQEGEFSRRGEVYTQVTHRPGERSRDVVSFVAGYSFAEGAEATLQLSGRTYRLKAQNDTAWTLDDQTDRAIAAAIRQGTIMIFRGSSSRGTRTADIFSLAGADAAYLEISRSCGLPP